MRLDIDDVAEQPRAFVKLDQRHHVGHFAGEGGMIYAMENNEAVHSATAAHFLPAGVVGQTMRTEAGRGKPEFSAMVATGKG
jgi:hypothetical protein